MLQINVKSLWFHCQSFHGNVTLGSPNLKKPCQKSPRWWMDIERQAMSNIGSHGMKKEIFHLRVNSTKSLNLIWFHVHGYKSVVPKRKLMPVLFREKYCYNTMNAWYEDIYLFHLLVGSQPCGSAERVWYARAMFLCAVSLYEPKYHT